MNEKKQRKAPNHDKIERLTNYNAHLQTQVNTMRKTVILIYLLSVAVGTVIGYLLSEFAR